MGTQSAPDIIIPIVDTADGSLESGLTAVKIVPIDGTLANDAITLNELGSTGKYAKTTSSGSDAVDQDVYLVYADSGSGDVLRGVYIHGGDFIDDHIDNTSNPHSITPTQLTVTDTGGYYTSTDVEEVLQEIGADLANKADTANTILTTSATQSVDSGKPKITNLNADKLDGYDASNTADSIPILDSNADLPLAQIPDTLTGKDADTVDGKEPGTGDDNLAQISTDSTPDAGKIHSSMLGVKDESITPVGTIMAWAKNLTGVPSLPAGWMECDGTQVTDADSPLNGTTLPDLNDNTYLEGQTQSGNTGGSNSRGRESIVPDAGVGWQYVLSGDDTDTRPKYYAVVWIIRIK